MPELHSPNWDEGIGVCKKHWLPATPCPACIESADADIEWSFSRQELAVAYMEGIEPIDLLPEPLAQAHREKRGMLMPDGRIECALDRTIDGRDHWDCMQDDAESFKG